jgi:hypothetical protein
MGVHASKEHGGEGILPSCLAVCTACLRYASWSRHCPALLYVSMTAAVCPLVGPICRRAVQRIASRMHIVVAASPVPIQ